MKNKMIKMSTRVISAMLVAATVFTTVAPTVYAAEPTAIAEEATIVYEAPSEVPEQMNSDTSEETQAGTTSVFCTSERLDEIAAMEISDPAIRAMRDRAVEADRSLFCAGLLKRYYLQKGPNLTFILGIYYIPSPIVYEIVQVIEHEVENGNRSYIYNGQFYASPEEDPTFNEFLNR